MSFLFVNPFEGIVPPDCCTIIYLTCPSLLGIQVLSVCPYCGNLGSYVFVQEAEKPEGTIGAWRRECNPGKAGRPGFSSSAGSTLTKRGWLARAGGQAGTRPPPPALDRCPANAPPALQSSGAWFLATSILPFLLER